MTPQTPAADLIAQIEAGVAQRIADADNEAREADVAFAAGKFEDFYKRKCQDASQRIADEYEQIAGQTATGGNGEEGG